MANSVDPDLTVSSRSSLIWVCTVCPGISVQNLRTITVYCCRLAGIVTLVTLLTTKQRFFSVSPVTHYDSLQNFQNEPRNEKTCLRGLRPGETWTGLLSFRSWLEPWNCEYTETRGSICAGWCVPLLFAYGKNSFSHDGAHIISSENSRASRMSTPVRLKNLKSIWWRKCNHWKKSVSTSLKNNLFCIWTMLITSWWRVKITMQ